MREERRVKTKFDISSGGVIYWFRDGDVRVCLIKTPPKGNWQLPKGLVDKNESLEETAVREVKEETGLDGITEGRIDKIDYWFWLKEGDKKVRHHKIVYFYLIKYSSGSTNDHDQEVEEACWFPIKEALERITFKSEKEVIQKAGEILLGKTGESVNSD